MIAVSVDLSSKICRLLMRARFCWHHMLFSSVSSSSCSGVVASRFAMPLAGADGAIDLMVEFWFDHFCFGFVLQYRTLPIPLAGAGGAGMKLAAALLAATNEAEEPCDTKSCHSIQAGTIMPSHTACRWPRSSSQEGLCQLLKH